MILLIPLFDAKDAYYIYYYQCWKQLIFFALFCFHFVKIINIFFNHCHF